MVIDPPAVIIAERVTRVPSRLLRLARWLVLGLIIFSIVALLISIVLFPATVSTNTASLNPNENWTTDMTRAALDQLGWSQIPLVWFFAILGWINAVVYCAVGLIVFHRKADSWFGLYIAVTFSVLLTSTGASQLVRDQAGAFLGGWYTLTSATNWQFLFIMFYLFPNGRFVPAWTRWLVLGWLAFNFAGLVDSSLVTYMMPFFIALVLSPMISQVYRYRRVSDALQRQQTKWIAFMGGVFVLIFIPTILTFTVPPPTGSDLAASFLVSTFFPALAQIWFLCLPIVIAIAILRYRLWDIDIIIRRTLVYLPLTAILAGVFAATIKILQILFNPLFGQQSEATAVLTTLIVVAVFDPIKRWIQKIVDARFKEDSNPEGRWKAYDVQVQAFAQIFDAVAAARRLLEEAVALSDAKDGAVYLQQAGEMQLVHVMGTWQDTPEIVIPLEHQGRQLGRLALGARSNGRTFTQQDRELLGRTANAVSAAIAFVGTRTAPG